jgi:hypothetical protein
MIQIETDWNFRDVEALADKVYSNNDQAAAISSGSFQTDGMLVWTSQRVRKYHDDITPLSRDPVPGLSRTPPSCGCG